MNNLPEFLFFGAICGVLCAAATAIGFLWREELAERRQQEAVTEAAAPMLARWRPAAGAGRHVRRSWLSAAAGGVRAGVAWLRAGSRPAAVSSPPTLPAVGCASVNTAAVWPTNPQPTPASAPLSRHAPARWPGPSPTAPPFTSGRVPATPDVGIVGDDDFVTRIHSRDEELRQWAHRRLTDPDATVIMPAQRGVSA